MLVAVALQLVYIAKFFWWETGYLRSLDIMHDRAGFYICWGCLVWVPAIYTSSTLYLVGHPNHLGAAARARASSSSGPRASSSTTPPTRSASACARRTARRPSGGSARSSSSGTTRPRAARRRRACSSPPASGGSRATSTTCRRSSARLFWTLPALFGGVLPYFYVVFLIALLTDRALRDDNRCAIKYGRDWKEYCEIVRYRILPGIL